MNVKVNSGVQVSFVIPCLNEEDSIASVLTEIYESFRDSRYVYEIIVADNGSQDKSCEIAASLGARVINVPEKGYGSALRAGIDNSSGEFVVMGDADGSYTFGDALPMIEMLQNGSDLVIGNRFKGGIEPGAMPFLHKYLGNPVLSWLGKFFFRLKINDFHCGLRAFNRAKILELKLESRGMEFASEMIVSAGQQKLRIDEIPVTLRQDLRNRPPHLNTWRDGWRHLRYLLSRTPTWTFLAPAVVLSLLAITFVLLSLEGPIQSRGIDFSYRTSIVVGSVAGLVTGLTWAFAIGRELVGSSFNYPKNFLEVSISVSIAAIIFGSYVMFNQFLQWQSSGFAAQPLGKPLLQAIASGTLMTIGGISLNSSLILALARKYSRKK